MERKGIMNSATYIIRKYPDVSDSALAAADEAVSTEHIMDSKGYMIYTFKDGSFLVQSGSDQIAVDPDNCGSVLAFIGFVGNQRPLELGLKIRSLWWNLILKAKDQSTLESIVNAYLKSIGQYEASKSESYMDTAERTGDEMMVLADERWFDLCLSPEVS